MYLVLVVSAARLEGMCATNQHPLLVRLGDHSDEVLALRLKFKVDDFDDHRHRP